MLITHFKTRHLFYFLCFHAFIGVNIWSLHVVAEEISNNGLLDEEIKTEKNSLGSATSPSLALLEFMADFDDIDDQTFELILLHGIQDSDRTEQSKTSKREKTGD